LALSQSPSLSSEANIESVIASSFFTDDAERASAALVDWFNGALGCATTAGAHAAVMFAVAVAVVFCKM
jgi:hypothetical protein